MNNKSPEHRQEKLPIIEGRVLELDFALGFITAANASVKRTENKVVSGLAMGGMVETTPTNISNEPQRPNVPALNFESSKVPVESGEIVDEMMQMKRDALQVIENIHSGEELADVA